MQLKHILSNNGANRNRNCLVVAGSLVFEDFQNSVNNAFRGKRIVISRIVSSISRATESQNSAHVKDMKIGPGRHLEDVSPPRVFSRHIHSTALNI